MRPFYANSRHIHLEQRNHRTFLKCQSQRRNGEWADTELDLDGFLGNNNGQFDYSGDMSGFTQSADKIRLVKGPHGQPVLRASLRNVNGELEDSFAYIEDWICNVDGRLLFDKPRKLRDCEVVVDDRTFFLCKAQKDDGSWVSSRIELGKYIGNDDGKFDVSGTGSGFTHSAKDIRLQYEGVGCEVRPFLKASLKNRGGEWREASVDLYGVVKNNNGTLTPLTGNHHGP